MLQWLNTFFTLLRHWSTNYTFKKTIHIHLNKAKQKQEKGGNVTSTYHVTKCSTSITGQGTPSVLTALFMTEGRSTYPFWGHPPVWSRKAWWARSRRRCCSPRSWWDPNWTPSWWTGWRKVVSQKRQNTESDSHGRRSGCIGIRGAAGPTPEAFRITSPTRDVAVCENTNMRVWRYEKKKLNTCLRYNLKVWIMWNVCMTITSFRKHHPSVNDFLVS